MKARLFGAIALMMASLQVNGATPVKIYLNQVGYYPDEEKVVVLEGIDEKAMLTVSNSKGKVVLKPNVARKAVSPWSEKTRFIVDISSLKTPGRYTIACEGEKSEFVIAKNALHDLSVASLKLFYLMRTGVPIEAAYAGKYARGVGHSDTHVLIHPSAASPGREANSVISSPLGWYDAGDYNKYVVNSAFSIGMMLACYEQNKDYFKKLSTNIPESRNATPDILDEMMFNLKWLLTMQDPEDGGVYHKLTTPNFEGFVMPSECKQQRYVVAKSVTAALDFAAVMAQSARLLKGSSDYSGFASQAETAAKRAYEWAKANPNAFYNQFKLSQDFKPAVNTGTYGDMSARDERFWAATELYKLTADGNYLEDAKAVKPARFNAPTWGNVAGLGTWAWIAQEGSELHSEMLAQLKDYCEALVANVGTSSFQAPFGDKKSDFGWGCLAEGGCANGVALMFADRYLERGKYMRYALENMDYILGRNATGYCFVTGFGTKSPMHPHHRLSSADGIEEPFPGMLVGGPNPGQQDKRDGNLVYPSNFPDESYLDVEGSYASNEIAINWNASLVALVCWIDALKGK